MFIKHSFTLPSQHQLGENFIAFIFFIDKGNYSKQKIVLRFARFLCDQFKVRFKLKNSAGKPVNDGSCSLKNQTAEKLVN